MDRLGRALKTNAKIMKSSVSRHAIIGVVIAFTAIIFATLLSSYFQYESIGLGSIIKVQKTNITLWFLDAMPFVFAFWGQYTSSIMAYEASSMVIEQTSDLRDLTVALEYKAAHEATHDTVTDLPNRVLMLDRLDQAIQTIRRQEGILGVLILEIDNFKEINDTLGHFAGDNLIKQIVSRLQGVVRKSDTLARIGGDEFAILLTMIKDADQIIGIIKKIQKTFINPFTIDGLRMEAQSSIGVAIAPEHGKEMDTILQRANLALVAAKQDINKFAVYKNNMDKLSPHRLTMVGELRQAIEEEELILHFQPKVSLKTNRIEGVEALVRWNHPEHGFLKPDEFIPLAERTGLIKPLSTWVFNNALCQGEKWHQNDLKLNVAVNLSPTTFLDPELPNTIIGLLSLYEIPASYLTLEITEGSMIKDPELAMEILDRLRERGVHVSIDDFGTGYSSLAYLRNMPVSEIKIDKSFVIDMLSNKKDAVIVKSIIDLGHNLSMRVVAEGVEDKPTALELKKLGCDLLQGYYFSRPLNIDNFNAWLPKKKTQKQS